MEVRTVSGFSVTCDPPRVCKSKDFAYVNWLLVIVARPKRYEGDKMRTMDTRHIWHAALCAISLRSTERQMCEVGGCSHCRSTKQLQYRQQTPKKRRAEA